MFLPRRDPAWPPPRLLTRWQVWTVAMVALLVPFFVPIPVELRRSVLIGTLGDRLHLVLPAAILLLLYWKGPLRGRLLAAGIATAVIGGLIEFVQRFVGRSPLLHDWLMDLVGIGLVSGWVVWRAHRRRAGLVLMILLVAFVLVDLRSLPGKMMAAAEARERFPLLDGFESAHVWQLWNANDDAELHMPRSAAFSGKRGLQIVGGPPSRWPGAHMRRFPHDWTGYRAIELKARVTGTARDSVPFGLRLDDFKGVRDEDWLSRRFMATHAWRTFSLPLAGAVTRWSRRPFDLKDVDHFSVFLITPADTAALEIDDIRLVR